ncbi:hypothetical protein PROFUN_09058 [Planoprotostelium fungivorum]|uniref:CNH domain-containing protein n=1 Tax=Planoprotostelium fungivorum TaxID=1890364 RepID=A0A2P6NID6_9EUKA|nr:hypothetical protein PROFUN_09058 [Planoprotostelium fungivorum]
MRPHSGVRVTSNRAVRQAGHKIVPRDLPRDHKADLSTRVMQIIESEIDAPWLLPSVVEVRTSEHHITPVCPMVGHLAFELAQVVANLPLKISSVEPWTDTKLLVGTQEGVLFVYEAKDGNPRGNMELGVLHKTFSKRPINKLSAIEDPRYNILISLSDSTISIHNLSAQFELQSQIARGCNLYTIEKNERGLWICAAIKKKLHIFQWDNGNFVEIKELPLTANPLSLVWCGDRICVGYKKDYILMHTQTRASKELFPTGNRGVPLCTLLPDQQMLLGRDEVSIFLGHDGQPTRPHGLTWSEMPLVLGYSFPYVLAVLPKSVEIHAVSGSQNLVQTIQLKNPQFLGIKEGKSDSIYVAATNTIWRLISVPIIQQIDQLLNEKDYEQALQLSKHMTTTAELKEKKALQIKMLYAYHMFAQGQYEKAMNFFDELRIDPVLVIGLYPNLLPRDMQPKPTAYPEGSADLNGAALDRALLSLVSFLNLIRPRYLNDPRPIAQEMSEDYATVSAVSVIVDTCLLKALIKTDDRGLMDLVSKTSNRCHLKESKKVLVAAQKENDALVMLYRSKGMHREALELLTRMRLTHQLVSYLKQLGNQQFTLILEFSSHALQTAPDEALSIFTQKRDKEDELPADKCLAHIKPWAPQLIVPFLEYIIHERKDTSPDFHNELISNYLETVRALRGDFSGRSRAQSETGLLATTRKKLMAFLESSQYYTAGRMLTKFPREDLFEERAILLKKIGQHEKALFIYAHELKDYRLAEEYCTKNYNPDKEEASEVFLTLMKVYLKPAEKDRASGGVIEPTIKPALELLNKHYKRMNVTKALELLPPTTPIRQLYPVLEAVVRDSTTEKRNDQVVKNLLKSENRETREALIRARSRAIHINEERMCPVCSKRLGPNVFACYPNNVVTHYACCKDKFTCPVTGRSFRDNN